ncbi:cell wall-active antibiotic response 4TMS protein YvqF [Asanoa ferruginea]|uniref:Cell wall-active antibiotic response 4TMS protein YvqF n=1 Tax=Asanoa ferruginea TaxID=53367 RepID=A0A3D9ZCY8_9ACTN|nr:LiaF domain-containing protein [Asanoa ferruginea]REF94779.1 cell wall-active antibiotic response 4TMS protein YvqF [Asanoa ferruginea]GIF45643.1 hypothetical protein Afe04nite_01820 [Asanoa ferruginea]
MENNETQWHVGLLGGVKRRGAWRMSRHLVAVSAVGGVNADLTEARFDTAESILTKVSLVGGVSLTVPHDVDVEVGGFSLFGGSNIEQAQRTGPAAHTVRVRNYGVFGGVRVCR